MQQVLKQSTAATTIVGPILDSAGAAYTGAAIADLNITKNGVTAAMAAAATLTHDHNGHYLLLFTTGNTDTLGRLDITCNKSTYAMPPKTFEVLSATTFDALVTNAAGAAGGMLYNGSNTGAVLPRVTLVDTLTTYTGDTPQTGDSFARIGAAGAGLTNIDLPNQTMDIVGNITGNLSGSVGSVTGAVGSVASGGIAAASFAAGAIDNAAIATDAIGSAELAASAVTEIQSGLSTLDAAGVRTAVGLASANLDTQLDALPTNAELATSLAAADDAVLAAIAALNNLSQANVRTAVGLASANLDTQLGDISSKTTNLPSDPADASDVAAAFSTVNATLATVASYVDTEVAAIKAKTDNLPSDPADASDIAASFTSIASTLTTIAGYVDTEVAAIKAKTDQLTFTTPNKVDATADVALSQDNIDDIVDGITASGIPTAEENAQATAAALAGQELTVRSLFDGRSLVLYKGAEVSAANGNSVTWDFTTLPDLTGGTARFHVVVPKGDVLIDVPLAIENPGTATQTLRFTLSGSDAGKVRPPEIYNGVVLYKVASGATTYSVAREFPVQARRM